MIEELKSWKGIRVEGIIFKDAVYLCERYQLYRVKHPNLGFLMCQVLPKKESVEDFYTFINGVKISERYKYHDYFTEALFIYRDDLYEYVFFHNFQTLGEIIAKRISTSAPKKSDEMNIFNVPLEHEYNNLYPQQICSLFESRSGRNVYSMLSSDELESLIERYLYDSRWNQEKLMLQDFNIHRYCYFFNENIKSNIFIYDKTVECAGLDFLTLRKKNIGSFCSLLFRNLSPSFRLTFEDMKVNRNRTISSILSVLQEKYKKKTLINRQNPWLSSKIAYFIHKTLQADNLSPKSLYLPDKFLSTMLWCNFFFKEGVDCGQWYGYMENKRLVFFHTIKVGMYWTENYEYYVKNQLHPLVVKPVNPNQAILLPAIKEQDQETHSGFGYTQGFSEFSSLLKKWSRKSYP